MKNTILLLLFALCCLSAATVAGQSRFDPTGSTKPYGGSSPTATGLVELIFQYDDPVSLTDLQHAFPGAVITPLDDSGTLFLVVFPNGVPASIGGDCSNLSDTQAVIQCIACSDVGGDPGSGTDDDLEPDGIWPNYDLTLGANGPVFPDAGSESSLCVPHQPTPSNYDPLALCGGLNVDPEVVFGDEVVDIAILDSGIDPTQFEDYFSYQDKHGQPQRIVQWHPVTEAEERGQVPFKEYDPYGHGTAVALAAISLQHRLEAKQTVRLHSYRILTDGATGSLANLIIALTKALEAEMDIINISLGFQTLNCQLDMSTQLGPLFKILDQARSKGVLIVTSAGNDSNDLGVTPQFPAAINSNSNVLTVAARSCDSDNLWDGSNYAADYVDLIAPGENVLVPYAPGGCFISVDGTSFATPLMTSLLAAHRTVISGQEIVCIVGNDASPVYGHLSSDQPIDIFEPILEDGAGDCIDFTNRSNWPGWIGEYTNQEGDGATGSASPNPFSNYLTVELPSSGEATLGPATVGLYDLNTGSRIYFTQTNSSQITINTINVNPGRYFVRITNSMGQYIHQVFKQQ